MRLLAQAKPVLPLNALFVAKDILLACQCVLLHVQKQQQAKEAEALLATAPAAPPAAAEMSASSPAAADNEKNNLVHAWVMVLSGKREVSSGLCLHMAQL